MKKDDKTIFKKRSYLKGLLHDITNAHQTLRKEKQQNLRGVQSSGGRIHQKKNKR